MNPDPNEPPPPLPQAASGSPDVPVGPPALPTEKVNPPPIPAPRTSSLAYPPTPYNDTSSSVGHARPQRLGWGLTIALVVLGILLATVVSFDNSTAAVAGGAAYRVGEFVSSLVIMPTLIWGLFCIGRSFRTRRTAAVIAIVMWSLSILGALQKLPRRIPPSESKQVYNENSVREFWSSAHNNADNRPSLFPSIPTYGAPRGKASTQNPLAEILSPEAGAKLSADFSEGSDQRFIKRVSQIGEEKYHEVVTKYRDACEEAPLNVQLAQERVSFIEHFAFSEDETFATSDRDLHEAKEFFKTHFGHSPEYILYDLQNVFDPQFENKAAMVEGQFEIWEPKQVAKFYLLRARSAEHLKNHDRAAKYAASSLALDRTAQTTLLLARELILQQRDAQARTVLSNISDLHPSPYEQKQRMTLLFQLKDYTKALEAYRELRVAHRSLVSDDATAAHLAESGDVEDAREIFSKPVPSEWDQALGRRRRFEFALRHGTAAEALSAYSALRGLGLKQDPVGNARLRLFLAHPGAAWHLEDVGSVLLLVVYIGAAFGAPFLLFAPVHYWSLLRRREPTSISATKLRGAGWGLGATCTALGLLLLAQSLAYWVYSPERLRKALSGLPQTGDEPTELLHVMNIYWACAVALVLVLIIQRRSARILSVGQWGLGKAVGVAFVTFVGLRMLLGAYVILFPGAMGAAPALVLAQSPAVIVLMREMLNVWGPFGLIAVTALLVPVIEEFFFRGMLLPALNRHVGFWSANIIQALLFASLHGLWGMLPFYILFALVSGEMVRRCGGLMPSVLMHVLNNLVACMVLIRSLHH